MLLISCQFYQTIVYIQSNTIYYMFSNYQSILYIEYKETKFVPMFLSILRLISSFNN